MWYAERERQRERNDPRPIPDSPWTIAYKRLTGQRDKIVVAHERPELVEESDGLWTMLWKRAFRRHPAERAAVSDFGTDSAQSDPIEQLISLPGVTSQTGDEGPRDERKSSGSMTSLDNEKQQQPIFTEREKQSAYLLLRVASWQLVFYMICCDVLGWYTAPMAFRELGYGPGVLVYTGFFIMAFCSGQILWRMYLSMDSERYPVKCYADLGERTYGPVIRHAFNALQSLQLLVSFPRLPG